MCLDYLLMVPQFLSKKGGGDESGTLSSLSSSIRILILFDGLLSPLQFTAITMALYSPGLRFVSMTKVDRIISKV